MLSLMRWLPIDSRNLSNRSIVIPSSWVKSARILSDNATGAMNRGFASISRILSSILSSLHMAARQSSFKSVKWMWVETGTFFDFLQKYPRRLIEALCLAFVFVFLIGDEDATLDSLFFRVDLLGACKSFRRQLINSINNPVKVEK